MYRVLNHVGKEREVQVSVVCHSVDSVPLSSESPQPSILLWLSQSLKKSTGTRNDNLYKEFYKDSKQPVLITGPNWNLPDWSFLMTEDSN